MTARAIPALAFVLLASLATACGVESTASDAAPNTTVAATTTTVDEPDPTSTEPDASTNTEATPTTTTKAGDDVGGFDDLPPDFEDQYFKGMIEDWIETGLTEGQAHCLADTFGRDMLTMDDSEIGMDGLMQYFTDCGIDPDDFPG